MVRGREGAGPPPPFHGVQAWAPQIRKLWRDIGKAHGWKHPRAPSVRWLWREKSTGAVSDFLGRTRVHQREKDRAGGGGGGQGGPGRRRRGRGGWARPTGDVISLRFSSGVKGQAALSFIPLSFSFVQIIFSFVWRIGEKEIGAPY